ncbi:MAG: hypothetical protein HKN85_05670 [Gammaproteobacteria bacterium]|nr:hypothetical protein [Gammaproteobacteria bacterium]
MNNTRKLILSCVVIMFCAPAFAEQTEFPYGEKRPCMQDPLAEFGRYIGEWDIADSTLSPDGKQWVPGAGGKWNFVCIGNGIAIQDFWLPNDGKIGTNLRTYNEQAKQWDIAWTITGMSGFAHILARKEADGNIVMHYKSPIPEPARRITFFPPTAKGWDWKLEISSDAGENWIEVYRITATPTK